MHYIIHSTPTQWAIIYIGPRMPKNAGNFTGESGLVNSSAGHWSVEVKIKMYPDLLCLEHSFTFLVVVRLITDWLSEWSGVGMMIGNWMESKKLWNYKASWQLVTAAINSRKLVSVHVMLVNETSVNENSCSPSICWCTWKMIFRDASSFEEDWKI